MDAMVHPRRGMIATPPWEIRESAKYAGLLLTQVGIMRQTVTLNNAFPPTPQAGAIFTTPKREKASGLFRKASLTHLSGNLGKSRCS